MSTTDCREPLLERILSSLTVGKMVGLLAVMQLTLITTFYFDMDTPIQVEHFLNHLAFWLAGMWIVGLGLWLVMRRTYKRNPHRAVEVGMASAIVFLLFVTVSRHYTEDRGTWLNRISHGLAFGGEHWNCGEELKVGAERHPAKAKLFSTEKGRYEFDVRDSFFHDRLMMFFDIDSGECAKGEYKLDAFYDVEKTGWPLPEWKATGKWHCDSESGTLELIR